MLIEKIQRVGLREVWKHEASDFTTWLEENLDILSECIDLELSSPEREQAAGAFSVDLVVEDSVGNTVVIENQLEKSNHDHLGKIITYLVAMEARAAIWIVSDPRPEHISAISWLNESSSADFYLLKLEAIRIGESAPTPLLTLIVGPSDEGRSVGQTKKVIAERYHIRQLFWTDLLDQARSRTNLHSSISPSKTSWISASAGRPGLSLNYVVRKNDAGVELYIDRGKERGAENKKIFESLEVHKDEIESAYGAALEWQSLEGKRACRIRGTLTVGGYRSVEGDWPTIQKKTIDAMIRLEKAISPFLTTL